MKNISLLTLLIALLGNLTFAQTARNASVGYYGQTLTHPGIVLGYEMEKIHSDKASTPLRLDVGIYTHPRNHVGVFLNLNYGVRRYFQSGLFLEESIGLGVLGTILNGDAVFKVGEDGNVTEASRFNTPDLMPSLTLGIGYDLSKNERRNMIWLRPTLYWQFPHKTTANFTPALQIGFTHQLSDN